MVEFARRSQHVVIDADGHVCEPVDLWETHLPSSMRERGPRVRYSDELGTQHVLVEDHVAIPMGLAGLGNAGMHQNQDFGNALRYPDDLNPGGWDPKERLGVMDREGIDIAVLYCGLGQSLGGFTDVDLAVASHQVWNDWIADWTSTDPERLVGTAVIPPHDPRAAAQEVHRARALGLVAGVIRPNPVNGVPLWSPAFDPMYEALAGMGMPLGLHGAGLYDIDGVSKRMIDLMAMGTHHALILFMDQYMTLGRPRVRRRLRTAPRPRGARAGVRRWLDRALDGPLRRVPRGLRVGTSREAEPHPERVLPAELRHQLRSGRANDGGDGRPRGRGQPHLGQRLSALRREVSGGGRRVARARRAPA